MIEKAEGRKSATAGSQKAGRKRSEDTPTPRFTVKSVEVIDEKEVGLLRCATECGSV